MFYWEGKLIISINQVTTSLYFVVQIMEIWRMVALF